MFGRLGIFLRGVRGELKKVSWSTRQELISSTWVVITTVALLAIFVGFVDLALSRLVSLLIK